ncbi:MAG: helix-turn-helix domain-containing protein [Eubacteriales bacterium]
MQEAILTEMVYEECESSKAPVRAAKYPWNAIHYILGGRGYFCGKELSAGKGFVCLYGDSVTYRPEPTDPWKYIWVRIDGKLPVSASGAFDFWWSDELMSLYRTFTHEGQYKPRNDLCARGLASVLLSFHTCQTKKRSPYVDSARRYLELNLGENIRIGELAGLLHVDRCYLRTLFCAEEGVSPKEYLMQLRLDRAKELLLDGKISVTEVGAEVGFGDVLAFSRFFRSRTGISPSEYKKKREESM